MRKRARSIRPEGTRTHCFDGLHRFRTRDHAHRPRIRRAKGAGAGRDGKSDIDLWELNEAFASVVLRFMEAMNIDHGDINVNGGAIAMGHPLGATGAMILGTVLDELERSEQVDCADHAVHRRGHGHRNHHRTRELRTDNMTYTTFSVDVDADGIALVTIDLPDASMNVWNGALIQEFGQWVDDFTTNEAIKGAVITSGKKSGFLAGADLDHAGRRESEQHQGSI